MTRKQAPRFSIRDRDGRWYAVDDRGAVVWDHWCGAEMDESAARAIVASYAESTRKRKRLRIVEVQK